MYSYLLINVNDLTNDTTECKNLQPFVGKLQLFAPITVLKDSSADRTDTWTSCEFFGSWTTNETADKTRKVKTAASLITSNELFFNSRALLLTCVSCFGSSVGFKMVDSIMADIPFSKSRKIAYDRRKIATFSPTLF